MKHITWNLGKLFSGDNDPAMEERRKAVRERSYAFINKWKDRSDYLEDPLILKEALDEYEAWKRDCGTDGDEGYYFWLRTTQDQNDPDLKAKFNKVEQFSKRIENDIQFFYLRIAKIPEEQRKKFLDHDALRNYSHYLERIFAESKYLLSEPEEIILNLKTPTSHSNWVKMTSGFLAKEEREVILRGRRKRDEDFFGDTESDEQQKQKSEEFGSQSF